MTITLLLDGTPYRIDGGQYPAGVGLPRVGDQVVVAGVAHRVASVQWHLEPLDERNVLRSVEIRAVRYGAPGR